MKIFEWNFSLTKQPSKTLVGINIEKLSDSDEARESTAANEEITEGIPTKATINPGYTTKKV